MILYGASGNIHRWRVVTIQDHGRFRKARRLGFMVALLSVALLSGVLSACGEARPRSARFGTYVSQLCEAMGPFEVDGQRLGRIIGRYGLNVKSLKSEQAMTNTLTAMIVDAGHVETTLETVGTPDIDHGRTLAATMVTTFDQIAKSDAIWRSKLRAGDWAWPTASRVKMEHLRTSIEALLLVGRQFERLPPTRERQNAMARSPVCRHVFGSIRVDGRESGLPVIAPPRAVIRAGGVRLREFKAGALVASESGCLACRRIGIKGNMGPGISLDHVGSRLTEPEIESAILKARSRCPHLVGCQKQSSVPWLSS